ncbi:MAG: hypothetical protein H6728_08785 [Myxococcales bacterium]|nr:hypothetical protein [Myxococcales bacterium]
MSSDTYEIRILALHPEQRAFDVEVTTTTAVSANDYAFTRSFVLMAFADEGPQGALKEALSGKSYYKEDWSSQHVGEYIASTEVLQRLHYVSDESSWGSGRNALGAQLREQGIAEAEIRQKLDEAYPRHRLHLRVTMTDPRWLEGLEVGDWFGTASYDVWWDDPMRPPRLQAPA